VNTNQPTNGENNMLRIIDGKTYNTKTARYLCELDSVAYRNDFAYHRTSLYQTKKGALFLAGYGGPLSMWAKSTGNGTTGGEGVLVIEPDEARSILETENQIEALQELFHIEEA
tara:strand:- start:101 stop:442 length:342 start_codon:yes stop_codon:yes gene_type:complete